MSDNKSVDYWTGYHDEAARCAAKAARQNAGYAADAAEVARNLQRDEARKKTILEQFPHVGNAMDALDLAQASSTELAIRALQSIGRAPSTASDPFEVLGAYLAGRGRAEHWRSFSGAVMDGSDRDDTSFVGKYLNGDT